MFKILFNYIRPSMEGDDGKFSYKRISAFVILGLISYMVKVGFTNSYQISALYCLSGLFLLLAAVVSFDQLIRFKNGSEDKKEE